MTMGPPEGPSVVWNWRWATCATTFSKMMAARSSYFSYELDFQSEIKVLTSYEVSMRLVPSEEHGVVVEEPGGQPSKLPLPAYVRTRPGGGGL